MCVWLAILLLQMGSKLVVHEKILEIAKILADFSPDPLA
jgi:hypothetical protein